MNNPVLPACKSNLIAYYSPLCIVHSSHTGLSSALKHAKLISALPRILIPLLAELCPQVSRLAHLHLKVSPQWPLPRKGFPSFCNYYSVTKEQIHFLYSPLALCAIVFLPGMFASFLNLICPIQ